MTAEKFVPVGDCPPWHDDKYEDILAWAGARVVYSDTFGNEKKGFHKCPGLAHWTLLDGHGFLGLDFKKVEDEKYARIAGAMFVYLNHARYVPTAVADSLCMAYAFRRKSCDEFERSQAATKTE